MNSTIVLTSDLEDLFILESIRSKMCRCFTSTGEELYKDFIKRGKEKYYSEQALNDKFDRMSYLMLMYDKIIVSNVETHFIFDKKIDKSIEIAYQNRPIYSNNFFLSKEELDEKEAVEVKDIVINKIYEIMMPEDIRPWANKIYTSLEELISKIYDVLYTEHNITDLDYIVDHAIFHANDGTPCDIFDTNLLRIINLINKTLLELMNTIKYYNKDNCDVYSSLFNGFNRTKNKDDAYRMLRVRISDIITLQPQFKSIEEIISFKNKNKLALKHLKNEIDSLTTIIMNSGQEEAIRMAIKRVREANEYVIADRPCKKIAKIATYAALPAMIESTFCGTAYLGSIFGIVGVISQLYTSVTEKKSSWIYAVR